MLQKTILEKVFFEGVGIHSGKNEKIYCYPAPANHGIVFEHCMTKIRFVVGDSVPIETDCATVFDQKTWRLSTVEHLLAACAGLGIDNLMVCVEGGEIPILDGSSLLFINKFLEVGLKTLGTSVRYIRILDDVSIQQGDRSIELKPYDKGISFSVSMTRPDFLKNESYSVSLNYEDQDSFCRDILPARTFGDFNQWDYLKENGLALGASLDNAIVFKDGRWIQELQWENEPIRHKVLDIYGDMFLLGGFLCAKIKACNSGHALHRKLILYLKQNPSLWETF
ncbi:UDP-3-O-[3-hydroxymyristoyl] N-acetylglucosamine deacetylase [Candidatus Babeliales bacterium]|nr:UDP-3-O-[3-hydroxymyristoyl] N-acetylglucosamine deacetylase [Candidatus Babeliales bacterium]